MRGWKRSKPGLAGFLLILAVALAPSPAGAEWSFSFYGPSGYIIIGSGTVAVGVAVAIGYIYIFGEARTSAFSDPGRAVSGLDPARGGERPAEGIRLDLLSFNF